MATNSQPQETPEYRTFREYYDRLVHAIQDPLPLATRLFTQGIIDPVLLQRVNVPALPTFQNTITLLTAVLGKIQTDPRMFSVFLASLNEDTSMQSLVGSMQSKCFIDKDMNLLLSSSPISNIEYPKKNKTNKLFTIARIYEA